MSDSVAPADRPSYRPYRARVAEVLRLSPHFVRIGFHSPEFADFGTAGLDQRVKIVFPSGDGTISDVGQDDPASVAAGDWYARWRALPADARSPFRTYTVRNPRPGRHRIDVDFVLHTDPGPAGAWADAARIDDEVLIIGPDERSPGSRLGLDWRPATARRILLAGDETAAPAIAGILESLGAEYDVDAFVEVPSAADELPLTIDPRHRVAWLARDGREHGAPLRAAVTEWADREAEVLRRASAPRPQPLVDVDVDRELLWDSPDTADGEFYAWIAGEAATVKVLRRLLVSDRGVDRRRVAFMGYWRRGQSERQE